MNFEEIMDFNKPYNQRNTEKLIERIKKNLVVPYIGAGMSILSSDVYPSWDQFLCNTFDEFGKIEDKSVFEKLNHEKKATFLYENIGKRTFPEHLKEVFGETHLDQDLSFFQEKPVYLLPIIFNKGLLITTNYDKVIEKSYALYQKTLTVAHPGHFEALNGALRNNELLLYKIHGDITEPIETIVLTEEQYDKAYENKNLINALKLIYAARDVLFLGSSMTKDRPIQLLCDTSRSGMSNFAIISCNKNAVKERRIELEKDYYTKSIIYPEGQHECLFIIMNYIAENVNPEGLSIGNPIKPRKEKLELTDEWFVNQNRVQIKNLGDRYIPELNVTPGINKVFDGLSRNDKAYTRLRNKTDELLISLRELEIPKIQGNITHIAEIIKQFSVYSEDIIEADSIVENLDTINKIVERKRQERQKDVRKSEYSDESINREIYYLRRAEEQIYSYKEYIISKEVQAFNSSFILLHSEGGMGKSHLIADVISQRNDQGKRSLLFLGQHFKSGNPIEEMLRTLELTCTSEELFEALNKKGEIEKSKIVIFIDALNEGNGKEIWNEYLAGIVEVISRFSWLSIVVSIRTEYVDKIFDNNAALKSRFIAVRHTGFSTIEHEALRKYFDYYGITCFEAPFSEREFRNPLFVRLFCEGFKNKSIDLSQIDVSDIYENYLSNINRKIADTCEYSRRIDVVDEAVRELVLFKYNQNFRNNLVSLNDAILIMANIERKYNISRSLLDELIANGILTQNTRYDDQECVFITYEKLDDYLYAKYLVDELNKIGVDEFRNKYEDLVSYEDILEALAIALSDSEEYELFELFEDQDSETVISAFCRSLKWRKAEVLNSKSSEYINNVVIHNHERFETLFEELILMSAKINHDLNADRTVEYILEHNMPDRDAIFVPLFDELFFEEDSVIQKLLDWCLYSTDRMDILDETIRLTAMMLSTFLISSNNVLRDKTTKALVKILNGKINILISVLDRYADIDDPYVAERLYAVAFGCVVSEQENVQIEKLALYVYDNIYKTECVYPNILLRDYAKNIIDYAKYKVGSDKLKALDIQPPYKSVFPGIPTDKEIDEYKYDYQAPEFKDYYWSQNSILSSMEVANSRNGSLGWYGDFGRYVFQEYFSHWKALDPNDLRNIAIRKIFDMGYDVEKHGEYDRRVEQNNAHRMEHQKCERIGKKYQWIALYTLAAEVADNYNIEVHTDEYGKTEEIYCSGSFEPNIRNIDPAISLPKKSWHENAHRSIHEYLYEIPVQSHDEWLGDFKDLPKIEDLLGLTYRGSEYQLLSGWYTWKEEKELGGRRYEKPVKDIWIQINSYIIKEDQREKYIRALMDVDLMGRWAAEPHDNYQLFNKEYYWSKGYDFFRNPYYCGEEWVSFSDRKNEITELLDPVLIPTFRYLSERPGDMIDGNSSSWYKPCGEIFKSLQLSYGDDDSILYNENGDIMCFDSEELLHENIGFFINNEGLEQFLSENGYSIFWTILAEKRIIQDPFSNEKVRFPRPHISGIAYYGSDNNLVVKTKQFK